MNEGRLTSVPPLMVSAPVPGVRADRYTSRRASPPSSAKPPALAVSGRGGKNPAPSTCNAQAASMASSTAAA